MNKMSQSIMGEHAFWEIITIDVDRTAGIEGILWECHWSEDKIHENAKIISWILIFLLTFEPGKENLSYNRAARTSTQSDPPKEQNEEKLSKQ